MHSREAEAVPAQHAAKVVIRRTCYLAAFTAIGCTTNMARARETGLDPKSIYSALKGAPVSDRFMANTITALQKDGYRRLLIAAGVEPTLDSLFEVAA